MKNGSRHGGIGIDGVVYLLEGIEKVKGGRGQQLPVSLGKSVEGLAPEVGDVKVSDLGILAGLVLVKQPTATCTTTPHISAIFRPIPLFFGASWRA